MEQNELSNEKKACNYLISYVLIPIVFFTLRDFGAFDLEGVKNQSRCMHKEMAMKKTLSGEIVKKYEDRKNHNIRTLEIKDSIGGSNVTTMLAVDVSGLFDKLKVGDYVNKESGQLMVLYGRAVRKDSIVLRFDCEE